VTLVAGWAGPARVRSVLAKATRPAVVPSRSSLKDLPSYAHNAPGPNGPTGCSAPGPNANRRRIGDTDTLPAGMGRRVLVRRIDRRAWARRAHTRRKTTQGSMRRPARQVQQPLSSSPPFRHASQRVNIQNLPSDKCRHYCTDAEHPLAGFSRSGPGLGSPPVGGGGAALAGCSAGHGGAAAPTDGGSGGGPMRRLNWRACGGRRCGWDRVPRAAGPGPLGVRDWDHLFRRHCQLNGVEVSFPAPPGSEGVSLIGAPGAPPHRATAQPTGEA
jgi:hypothetical protein